MAFSPPLDPYTGIPAAAPYPTNPPQGSPISLLPPANPPTGSEQVAVVQAGLTVRMSLTAAASVATPPVSEAPTDGQTYGRRSAAWTALAFAPLISPVFTGVPSAPLATPGTANTSQIATTAFVQSAISAISSGVTNVVAGAGLSGGGSGVVNIAVSTNGVTNTLAAQMPGQTLKGNNTGSTANPSDLSTATVMGMLGASPLNSPVFTGVPQAPTATVGTSTGQLATTSFVATSFAPISALPAPATVAPLMNGTAAVGISALYARQDHIHPSDTSRAPTASPAFTGIISLSCSAFVVPSTVAASGPTPINWANGEYQRVSLNANATLAVSNWPVSGNFARLVLDITNTGAFAISGWPTGTIWAGGTGPPTITPGAGKRDVIILMSPDGGTTVLGSIAGQNYA